jgi:hypothetical protein
MSEDRKFISGIQGDVENKPPVHDPDVWGIGHGGQPDWAALCGSSKDLNKLTALKFNFKKDIDNVSVELTCGKDGGSVTKGKTYHLLYSARTLPSGELAIKLDLNGNDVPRVNDGVYEGNQLDFFTNATWFLDTPKQEIIGVCLLDKPLKKQFNSLIEAKEAIDYITNPPPGGEKYYKVAPDVHGMIFRLHKTT